MKYRITLKFGRQKERIGSFQVVDFPGNCGYKILKYVQIKGPALTQEKKEYIADNIRHFLHKTYINDEKLVVTARLDGNHSFSTIDFIEQNQLLIGEITKGTHGIGKTLCAEYNFSGETKRLPNRKAKVLKGATVSFIKLHAVHW